VLKQIDKVEEELRLVEALEEGTPGSGEDAKEQQSLGKGKEPAEPLTPK
jgi:hypothetical protein